MNASAWEVEHEMLSDFGSSSTTIDPLFVERNHNRITNAYACYMLVYGSPTRIAQAWPSAYSEGVSWQQCYWATAPSFEPLPSPRVVEVEREPGAVIDQAFGSYELWPTIESEDENEDHHALLVFSITHARRVIHSESHQFRLSELPRWKPTVRIDRSLPQFLDNDDE